MMRGSERVNSCTATIPACLEQREVRLSPGANEHAELATEILIRLFGAVLSRAGGEPKGGQVVPNCTDQSVA